MTKENKTLSDEIGRDNFLDLIAVEDVKEFIKIIIDDIESFKTPTYNFKFLDKIKENIKKRAGEKLK